MSSASWIWCDAHGTGRNAFALFRRVLELPTRPQRAVLHLFADARYRLRVNGEVVTYGPARFVPTHPEHDSVDLAPWLHAGLNVVTVEAWSPNASSFQVDLDSRGGFIAWGEVACAGHTADLATPGDWRTRRGTAWDPASSPYTFAQGPVETVDLAKLPEAWFTGSDPAGWAEPTQRLDGPWGELTPRSTPPCQHRVTRPVLLPVVAALDGREERVSCRRIVVDLPARRKAASGQRLRFPYTIALRSPREQEIELGLFWGPHWLNGQPLTMANDPVHGNRQNTRVRLRAGENLLYGEPEVLVEVWAQYVAVPRAAGLELGTLRYGPVLSEPELTALRGNPPANAGELRRLDVAWDEAKPALGGALPARDLAWDGVGRLIARDAATTFPLVFDARQDRDGWVVLADFGCQFAGHAIVDIDAAPGTVLDIGIDERRRADGLLGFYHSNPFCGTAERIVLAGGRRTIELFHPRGGRYLQLAIRPPAGSGVVTLHGIGLRDHQAALARDGGFRSSDPLFDWVWETSHHSMQAVIEDCILADSWRERALYACDHYVQSISLACFSRDLTLAKRGLRLWEQTALPNGLMSGTPASWGRGGWIGASLYWIRTLHYLWTRDGELADIEREWPKVEAILAGPNQPCTVDGLWDSPGDMFIDWAAAAAEKSGQGNAVLNGWRCAALLGAADLAHALGKREAAERFRAEHEAVSASMRRHLWIADQGRFAARLVDGKADRTSLAVHGNALALAYGVASPEQAPSAITWLERALLSDVERAVGKHPDGAFEIFSLHLAFEALAPCGRVAAAERCLRDHYAPMRAAGAWTIWETLHDGQKGGGNLCQGWGTTAVRWLQERVLGVRPERPGDTARVVVAPDSTLEWAEGAVPHPRGIVRVSWRRIGDRLEIQASAPEGVTLRIAPGLSFAGLRVDARIGPAPSAERGAMSSLKWLAATPRGAR
jgi:hypothetical protein